MSVHAQSTATTVTSASDEKPVDDKPSIKQVDVAFGEVPNLDSRSRAYLPATDEEAALDKAINRKVDLICLPLLAFGFLLCGMDKTNIGNAATTSFAKDANLAPDDIPNAVSLLSVTFVTLQPVSVALCRYVGPKYWIPSLVITFGAICIGHAGIKNNGELIALRLLLGAAEAGYLPSCSYLLSTYYPRYMLGFRLGLFAGCYSIASAFASLIAYGCFQIKSDVLHDWQVMFVLEGAVTVATGLAMFFLLPKGPSACWFLKPDEREHCAKRMAIDLGRYATADLEGSSARSRRISKRDIKDVLTDWRKVLTVVFNILATLPVSAFGVFTPLIVAGMGYSSVRANLMAVPPFVVGAFGLFVIVYLSDRYRQRALAAIFSMLVAIIGLIVMVSTQNPRLRYGFLHICLMGAFGALPHGRLWCRSDDPAQIAWLANNSPEPGVRALVIGMNGYSNIAGVIAGQLYKSQYAPTYHYPLVVTLILLAIGVLGFTAVRTIYQITNRRRARQTADWTDAQIVQEEASTERRGDQKLTFVYAL